jgi:hypothetical protein
MVKTVKQYVVACVLVFWICAPSLGQHSDLTRKNAKIRNYSSVKFKKNRKMAAICPIFHLSEYPYQGIGFQIGDPFAITYKFYASEKFAFGIDFGTAASGLYSNLFREEFERFPDTDSTVLIYEGHKVINQNVFSARAFYYIKGPRAVKGLNAYVGAGWEVQFVDVEYAYVEVETDPPNLARSRPPVKLSMQPMGPQVTLGLEYAYFSLPVSAFLEGSGFFDIVEGWRRFQGGIGLRYVF